MSRIMNKSGKYVWGDNGNARIPTKEYKDNFDKIFRGGVKKEEVVPMADEVSNINPLTQLRQKLKDLVRTWAYDRGHSSGASEVESIENSYLWDLNIEVFQIIDEAEKVLNESKQISRDGCRREIPEIKEVL